MKSQEALLDRRIS